ncbi:uncharacterized protein LOC123857827 isoform X2 [Mirounga angustirostris]|uniref:uncharacterized protein LOC123857827 isoform X2 n=1 Tax=Mirounga angustirostris TaxID=9716 RepID=UPI001E68B0A7|nr:uncharacterized protein LOC123857827 isoform X2 [Mirounga angustirostris]
MVPGPNCAMLPASGHAGSIPPGYFIHPDTGKVLPEAGNLGYDLQGATLVPTTDFSSGGVRTSEAAILPYVPYPTCPATGSPPAPHLPVLQPSRTSQLGALMTDPATGIEVPVLAVTLHPQTRQWLTLGGTYCNPLTKTSAPLELGGPMEDPVTGSISPILGVGLDENTGQVLALGGLRDASGSLMLPGDSFEEPLSRKTVRLQGVSQREGQTVPHMGGSQALLDANVLVAQRRVTAVLQSYGERPGSRTQGLLEAAIKDMRQALGLSLHHALQQARRLERQLGTAEAIVASGGKIGMMCYPGTELWVPVLYRMEIPDPEGSGLMVPILGMETDGNSGDATPLAGSMEDADGKGLVPISIGGQAIDPLTGEPGPVIGAQTDPSAGVVVPIVQVLEALPQGVRDPGLIVASGSPACLENYPGDRFYGMIPTSLRAGAAACPLLIPFLKSLTAALVGAQGRGPGQEDQGPGTDADKADIMWTSPLFSTLEKVDIWSQAPKEEAELQGQVHHLLAPNSSLQDVPKPQLMQKEELITVQPTDLSAREFMVCQYDLSVLNLLIPELHAPEITLQIASRLPAMDASDNAFQGSFFYQSTENTLFVGRESLASAGSFILLLIHCLAHIATEDFRQDANPAFLRSFYKGLRAYFGEAFSTTLRVSAISWDSKLDQSISATLRDEQPISERGRDLLFLLLERKCESCLEPESSEEYRKRNTDLLLFTSMEHFLKSLLPAEQQIPRKARDQHGDEEKE